MNFQNNFDEIEFILFHNLPNLVSIYFTPIDPPYNIKKLLEYIRCRKKIGNLVRHGLQPYQVFYGTVQINCTAWFLNSDQIKMALNKRLNAVRLPFKCFLSLAKRFTT